MIIITSWLGRIPMLKAPCNDSSNRSKKSMAEPTRWARDKVQGQKLYWSSFVLVLFWLCSWRNFHPPPPLCSLSNTCILAKPRNKITGIPEATADFGCGRSASLYPDLSLWCLQQPEWNGPKTGHGGVTVHKGSHCHGTGGSVPVLGRHRPHRLLWSVLKGS